ncbi:MAG: hypothetical protein KDG89_08710 [Geminicoccaceae bacterium]|nr:hypothetical protein [Geminicoccaceae bacterium]
MARLLWAVALVLVLAGCARDGGGGGTAASSDEPEGRKVASTDGSFEGEIVGTPRSGSKFSKVKIGMRKAQVDKLIGAPDDTDSHITGKAFIPFFFGGDTQRLEAFYKGEGILTYSPGHFMGQPDILIRIIADRSEQGVAH